MRVRSSLLAAAALSAALHCTSGSASDSGSAITISALPRGYAASAFEAPVAFGGSWGSVGIGVTNERLNGDASVSVAAGLGNPDRYAGLDVAAVFSSLSDSDLGEGGLGDEGSFALKLHRNLGDYTAIAIGASAVSRWGGDLFRANNPAGHYVVITRAFWLGDPVLMLSGGAGHNVTNKNGNDNDVFGSAALYLTHWLSLIAEYDGFNVNAALSLAPLPQWLPLTLTCGYVDLLTDHNPDPRITIMAGLAYHF